MTKRIPDLQCGIIRNFVKVGSHIEDRFQIEGLDNIYSHIDELKNEVIFAGNHESVIDAFFKGLVLYKELRHKWINYLSKKGSAIVKSILGKNDRLFGGHPSQ